jgi:hypothetical protein
MNSISALPPIAASSQPNASIVFQGEAFPIFKEVFMGYSRTIAEGNHRNYSQFVVTSPVTRESVKIFVAICQGRPASFDNSQILDLLSLCEEWSVDSLKDHLLKAIENDQDQILTALRYGIERGIDTEELERRARSRFCELADRDELFELPVSVLRRIVDVGLQDTDFDKLFAFLKKSLDRFGHFSSVLFQGFALCHFSVSQLEELTHRRDMNWCYLSESVGDTLSKCIGEMAKHRIQFEDEHRQLADLQVEYRRAISDYEALQRTQTDLESRLRSLESSLAAFQSSVEGRLGLIESNGVSRTELEGKYAEKSELQSDYLTKSEMERIYAQKSDLVAKYLVRSDLGRIYAQKLDLEANYARKSELRSNYLTKSDLGRIYAQKSDLEANYPAKSDLERNYAQKSDLETNYARKSELQSGYLTKAEANSLELRCASKAFVDEQLNFLKRVTRSFPPIAGSPLKGIIHHLTLECGGNVHDRGVVSVTADRPLDDRPDYAAKNIADLEANSYFVCANAKDMSVCYDFKTLKVILTDYSIRSRWDLTIQNLKSWVIEVSNDGQHWTEADRRENRDELCAQNVVRSFAVSKPSVGRYVRLRQVGPSNYDRFVTVLSGFELFGALTF